MKQSKKASELILNPDGSLYHLHLKPGQVAEKVFFVGDPMRVEKVSKYFDQISFQVKNREFFTITGRIGKTDLSVISTGIGTDNIDIVWNELDAIFNFDLHSRTINDQLHSIKVLRLGTCGGLQEDIAVGSLVNSRYAIGADSLMHFYDTQEFTNLTFQKALLDFQVDYLPSSPAFYASEASQSFSELIGKGESPIKEGITLTAAGFYGPQGRNLGRVPLRSADLIDQLKKFHFAGLPVLNLEMETSGILGLGKGLGHQAASLSAILANRSTGKFSDDPAGVVEKLIKTGIELMLRWD
ncbi:MAG: nucleoside phosphorylase [Bacteroidia bacterium]|nr:nucleoside phosphorylase [Bacteroidia bacterium]